MKEDEVRKELESIFKEITGRKPKKAELDRATEMFYNSYFLLLDKGWTDEEATRTAIKVVRKALEVRYA